MFRLCLAALLLAAPAAADEMVFFQSPTKNIHCVISDGEWAEARCDMDQLTPTYTHQPDGCDVDWGKSFGVGPDSAKGALLCVGDTINLSDAQVLAYGKSIALGGVTCVSAKTGMTCKNGAGHGFALARAKQSLF